MRAPENNGGATSLMLNKISVWSDLLAATLPIATLKFNLREQVSRNAVHLIELAVGTTEGAMVGIFGEPVTLTIRANGLFTNFAFKRILKNVVAHAAY